MPYKAYYTNPGFGQGVENLSSALFPDPRRQQADRLNLLRQRELEQKINIGRRDAGAQDSIYNSIISWRDNPDADPTEAMAGLAAYGNAGAFGHIGKVYGQQRFLTGQAGDDPRRRFDLLAGMGEKPGVDTPVSFAEQDRIAGRNAGYDMDQALAVERLQQQGAMARHRESGDHITAAERNKAAEVARCIARNGPGSEDRCWAQADKHLKSEMTPAGQVITWNPVSQTVSTPERPEFQVPDIGGRSQFEGANMRPMPGAVGLARAGLNNALGTVGLPEWGPEINEWFTGIRRFRDQNAVALAQALEGRPSVYLVQMYRDLTVDPDAWIQGPEGVKRQLVDFNRNVAQNLRNLEDEYKIFGNSWDSETLRKANAELVALRDMQADANYMLAQFDRPGGQQAPGQQGEVSIPPVVPPEKHDLFLNMTPEQQAEYVGLLESLQGGQ